MHGKKSAKQFIQESVVPPLPGKNADWNALSQHQHSCPPDRIVFGARGFRQRCRCVQQGFAIDHHGMRPGQDQIFRMKIHPTQ